MILNKVFCGIDTIHITITRPRSLISFVGENPQPTDTLFYGVLDILMGRNFVVQGNSKKFVNNGLEYVQSNPKEILIQLRSTHLMKYGRSKVEAILKFLNEQGVKPKAKRSRKKGFKNETPTVFYQITRIDFTVDYETRIDLVKILNERIGYDNFFDGIQKGYFYRVIHYNQKTNKDTREHRLKELKIFNHGFELSLYNKKLEVAEEATPEKLQLYPPIYRDILIAPERKLFRIELRFFRSRSIAFNGLAVDELFALPEKEIIKFGKSTRLLKRKKQKIIQSTLFSRLFAL